MRATRLHIESIGGVAGDMLLAALLDLGADGTQVQSTLVGYGYENLALTLQQKEQHGIRGLSVRSIPPDYSHHHYHPSDVWQLLDRVHVPANVSQFARRVYKILVEAEGQVHASNPANVLLHEVGAMDSVLDVVGIATAWVSLGMPTTISYAPLPSGCGVVQTSHGVLACPVPAVRAICARYGLVLEPVTVAGETITPTGAAVLAAWAPVLCKNISAEERDQARCGVGFGNHQFEDRPNIVRLLAWDP